MTVRDVEAFDETTGVVVELFAMLAPEQDGVS